MHIIIRENQLELMFRRMLSEMMYSENSMLLTEGDSRLKKIITQIMPQAFNGLLDVNAPVSGPEYYINDNENTTWGEYLLFNLRHTFGLMSNADVPLLLYIAPIAWGNEVEFDKTNSNGTQVAELMQICQLLKKDNVLFTKAKATCGTFRELSSLCKPILNQLSQEEDEKINNTKYANNNGYEIREVEFEEASELGRYTSLQDGDSELCYTKNECTWRSYTNNGNNAVYVCLKDGWQNIEPEPGPNAPYDEYGLSMIFVFVNPQNNIAYSNTRWNHEYSENISVDHAFTKPQLSEIVGCNFYDVFKPSTENGETKRSKKLTAMVEEYINLAGRKALDYVEQLSHDMVSFRFNGSYNIMNTRTWKVVLPEMWFDWIHTFSSSDQRKELNGYLLVELGGKQNVLTPQFTLLSPERWFDYIDRLGDDTFEVGDSGKYNMLKLDGTLLPTWFDGIREVEDGFVEVSFDGAKNILNLKKNTFVFPTSLEYISFPINDEHTRVIATEEGFNIIDRSCNLLSPQWFDGIMSQGRHSQGILTAYKDGRKNLLRDDGTLVSPNQWFDDITPWANGIAEVELEGRFNYIYSNGQLGSAQWYTEKAFLSTAMLQGAAKYHGKWQ